MQLTRRRLRGRFADERGVTLVLMALLMVAMLGIAALVVNIGLVRADRQRNKSAADVAVTAGARALNMSGYVGPFRGACAAVDYVKANHAELATLDLAAGWTDGSGNAISGGNPCDPTSAAYTARYNQTCNAVSASAARQNFAWYTGTTSDGLLTVKVKAGYASADMTADGARDDAYHTDTGDPAQFGCDQLAVSVTEREGAGFGKVLGAGQLSSTIRSVARVDVGTSADTAIGLLLLERNDCAAADIGSSSSWVNVLGSATQPGLIHSDSMGDGAGCSSSAVLNGQYTTPGMMAGRSPDGTKSGIVTTTGLLGAPVYQNRAISGWTPSSPTPPTQVVAQNTLPATSPAPVPYGRSLVGRLPVDTKYRAAVANLRSQAAAYFALTSAPAGWRTVGCNPSAADLADTTSPGIWVNCASFGSGGTTQFQNKNFVFTGNINLTPNNALLQFPNAEKIFVNGTAAGGGQGVSISSGGSGGFTVNTGTAADCDARRASDPSKYATLVIGSNGLSVNSAVKMCQTFVFLMDGDRIYNAGEAPSNNTFNGKVNVTGGGGLEWTAPNVFTTRPTAAQMAASSPFEDLAMWTETSADSGGSHTITGGGTMKLRGVFFAPNANAFKIAGGGDGNITANAQFIVRKLFVTGGAHLSLTADPENSVLTPTVGGFRLVR